MASSTSRVPLADNGRTRIRTATCDPNQLRLFPTSDTADSRIHEQEAESRKRSLAASPSNHPAGQLAKIVQEHINAGRAFNSETLFRIATDAYEGTLSGRAFTVREAYDAAELGFNQWIRQHGFRTDVEEGQARKDLRLIEQAWTLMPAQTYRDQQQLLYQQFSTPAPYAYVCAWAAGVCSEDIFLEPSAGTGSLLVYALNVDAYYYANELAVRRLTILRELIGEREDLDLLLFNENAEHLNAILPAHIRPTVVLMNPPFSQTAGRLGYRRVAKEGTEHVRQALVRLSDGGRLVTILGHNVRQGPQAFEDLFNTLSAGEYIVRANVEVDGTLYRKCGTTFDTRVLVIDKRPVFEDGLVVTGRAESARALLDLLAPVRPLRAYMEPITPLPTPADHTHPVIYTRPTGRERVQADRPRPALLLDTDTQGSAPLHRGRGELEAVEALGVRPAPRNEARGALTASVFDAYVPHVQVQGARPHPTRLVESAAMAAAAPPPCTYAPRLPHRIVDAGQLSDAQLEAICYAGQTHSEALPEGPRCGFFLGDGTGVGKGRSVAGVILDNFLQGRRRALWISENRSLRQDALRDWMALGQPAHHLFDLGDCKGPVRRSEGVMFVSYDTLKGKPRNGKGMDRMEQVIGWLTAPTRERPDGIPDEEFDGVIVFDEAHNLQNALDTKGARGMKKASGRALAGLDLQRRLPNARVVYVSATGATEVANLAYAERLGLWGRGTPFPTVNAFVEKVSAGGIAAMELVAKDLKAMGLYVARSISYHGVEYRTLVHDLSDYQVRMYDKLAEAWQVVLRALDRALEVTKANKSGAAKSAAYSQFWGAHQHFFLHVLVALSGPSLIRDMERRLGEGKSCVVQLVSTMEAATERAFARAIRDGEDVADLDVTPRDQLLQYVQASFPTTQYEEYEDDEGRIRSRVVTDSRGNPIENPEAVRERNRLMAEVGSIVVPHGILDQLLDHFGHERVAEVTGRSRRFVRVVQDGVEQVVQQRRSRSACNADVDEFMAGKKRVLVFSQAGGTGRSYHADLAAQNQEQRVLYCVEPGWSSSRCVQGMGRVHRSNQRIEPELVLVTTNLKAQRRFLSTIARRLDQLGALTKGQRQTASQGLLSADFNLETPLARAALYNWFVDVYNGNVPGVTLDIVQEQMGLRILDAEGQLNQDAIPDVPKFLNRLLSLRTDVMDTVFDSWYRQLEVAIEAAREAGKLDVGVETITAERVVATGVQHVYTQPRTGAKTHVVSLELTRQTEITPWDEVWAKAREAQVLGFFAGFAVNKKSEHVYALLRAGSRTREEGQVTERIRRLGVRSNRLFDREEVLGEGGGYRPAQPDEAKRLWELEVEAAPAFYSEPVHLVTGAVLPIWDRIAGPPRIYRVQLTEDSEYGQAGERMIGRVIAPDHLSATLKALGAEQRKVEIAPAELAECLLRGVRAELSCGWVLKRRRTAGEWRIELVGPDFDAMRELEEDGVFVEVHAFKTRFFVPTGTRAEEVLGRITAFRPVVEMLEPDQAPSDGDRG